jgi:hypothetical protein
MASPELSRRVEKVVGGVKAHDAACPPAHLAAGEVRPRPGVTGP